MEIIRTVEALKKWRSSFNESVGFVPTMGALHEGHSTLIKRSVSDNSKTIVSIFVNPTQFLAGEDLNTYPKKEESDRKICELLGVDAIFMPEISTMYSDDEVLISAPNIRGYILEGHSRPGHFDGVLQVVMKLLNLVQANNAYFGKKDAQQLALIEQMVKNYFLSVNIIAVDTVRQNDGLALSSRNAYLSENERKEALKLSRSLKEAAHLFQVGENNCSVIKVKMLEVLDGLDVEYVSIVDRSFKEIENIEQNNTIVLVTARVGATRLIDNIWI